MYNLSTLHNRPNSKRPRKRVGRGTSSGHGKTAGRGTKGQKSRSGGVKRPGFEGGQTPLYRRLPKLRGFKNIPFRKEYSILNIGILENIPQTTIGPVEMIELGLVPNGKLIKILGNGELKRSVHVRAHAFSASAKAKIQAAGGSAEQIALKERK